MEDISCTPNILKFHHPITGEQIHLEAALPSENDPDTMPYT
jgi:hypothetical protein